MFIQIGDFEIYEYDKNNPDQRHLKYVLNNNDDFLKYVTKKIEERLKEGKILPGGGYQLMVLTLSNTKENLLATSV